jgi:valyl-tRNA synthetase
MQEQLMPKAYDPKSVDPKWYQFWIDLAIFKADAKSKKTPYCLVMPPPNVTGVLHMGHALVSTLQDILVRWKRMSGFEALWIPGTDHAGISTQTVVERHLLKTVGKKRKEFSREEFLEHVWKWKKENEHTILDQLKKLGCSCDWSRLCFTMDEKNNIAVRTMFKKLFDQGLIYRGDYLVNWDPVTQTALADDEVEYEEKESSLWHFKYPLADGSGFVHIATTRPETMLGDTAVAVSPKDARYQHLIGKLVFHPLREQTIPIIADPFVDPEFGTGMVKITPAHDPNDYKTGFDHKLQFINIMTPDGKVNENGGRFEGMSFADARKGVVEEMEQRGLLVKIEPYLTRIGVSYRSKAIIEPYLSKQWFLKMTGVAKTLLTELVETEQVKLIPENWENTYFHWINNLRDWCISRQLWWGHRIPIWYHISDPDRIICHDGDDLPQEVKAAPQDWVQEQDVLDTWFSSALWPFSTLGWPEKTPDLEKFYPNSTLITGYDILFFWVARMVTMGTFAMDKPPFPETFLHGLIYGKSYWRTSPDGSVTYASSQERLEYDLGKPVPPDVQSKWEKMSKSKGNVIDPIEIIDEYGTDAMRMTLAASPSQSREIDLDRRKFEEFRNFTNKVWNGARFVIMNLKGLTSSDFEQGIPSNELALEDRWILSQLQTTVREVNQKLSAYEFDGATLQAYDFYWNRFCSYYVEIVKPYLFGKLGTEEQRKTKQKLLFILLCQAVRLLHPMAPFITEELFQLLKGEMPDLKSCSDPLTQECIQALSVKACASAPYPPEMQMGFDQMGAEKEFQILEQLTYTLRNLRGEMKLPPGLATEVSIVGKEGEAAFETAKSHGHILQSLVKISRLNFTSKSPDYPFASAGTSGELKVVIPFPEELLQSEKLRLEKEEIKVRASIARLKATLENPSFVEKAPPALIEKSRAQLKAEMKILEEIEAKLLKVS